MKILVIGSGGREHALAWKLAQSPRVQKVLVAPGNAGIAQEASVELALARTIEQWLALAKNEGVAFTVVGPEAPLAEGIVDRFRAEGLAIFGPTQAAARLESSKAFAKAFMQRHGIPTARYAVFSERAAAHAYVREHGVPIVVKADGLAAGKGVTVASTLEQALAAIDALLPPPGAPEAADARIVIEEFLPGEEASFIVLCDGKNVLPLASAQDHKRLLEGDQGPNTGGMGAYSPAPVVTPSVHARVMREIITPTVQALAYEGMPFTGFLYAGLMIAPDGAPRVVEFNVRLGDPETQPILMRLKTDLVDLIEAALEGRLDQAEIEWDRRVALAVVLAAAGYPQEPRKGDPITGLPAAAEEDVHVFHAGTALDASGRLVTAGGRVLCVTALADTLRAAHKRAYEVADRIHFAGLQMRRDIGHRALKR
ncbi:MAG: phosphoribosylamine--glycine ligase [Casimicrobiaceae bacterium]|nr:phosphoribosylamine--glycine ligase [Casimicrobiaceae bacterium]MCX8097495.1 phosphoribosylamine--glycine ligase [Casimicrobiaceae bacterium]MDW8311213.1 phosphoribosylamine--glycine ligase [Burkholderiales bacterium]